MLADTFTEKKFGKHCFAYYIANVEFYLRIYKCRIKSYNFSSNYYRKPFPWRRNKVNSRKQKPSLAMSFQVIFQQKIQKLVEG